MDKGRPTRIQQVGIQKTLRTCFERGISASIASKETGINIKTICKYFDEWIEQINESDTSNFLERQKKEQQRIIISFDNDILESYKLLDEIGLQIQVLQKEVKLVPRHLFSIKLELMRHISNLKEKKGAISMQPYIESALDKKIDEMISKHVKDTKSN